MSTNHIEHADKVMQEIMRHLCKNLPLKERLTSGIVESSFVTIKEMDLYELPGSMSPHERLRTIHTKISNVPGRGKEATFLASVEAMSDEEAEEVALLMVDLAYVISKGLGMSRSK